MITYDSDATKSAFLNLSTAIPKIRPYVLAMEGLDLGPQPISQNENWDPLGKLPDVEAALKTVQQHCGMAQVEFLDIISLFVRELTTAVGTSDNPGPVLNDFSTVLAVVNELGTTNSSPTPQQRETVKNALQDLQSRLSNLLKTLQFAGSAGTTFVKQLPADIQTLTTGNAAIGMVIGEMKQNYKQAVITYSGQFGGGAIVKTLEQIVGAQIQGIEAIQNTVQGAISAEQPVASGISQLMTVFVTLDSDYQQAIQSVINASNDTFASGLLAFDVPNAQTYWQLAAQAAQSSGLQGNS